MHVGIEYNNRHVQRHGSSPQDGSYAERAADARAVRQWTLERGERFALRLQTVCLQHELELARCDGGTVELSRQTKKLGLNQGDLRITDINDTDQYKPKIKLAGKRLTCQDAIWGWNYLE